ncbi:MAG: alpha-ketoglutarate decarboxylase [Flavobacteriaceae bacterium]
MKRLNLPLMLIFLLTIITYSHCYSQDPPRIQGSNFWSNVRFGGGLGFGLNNGGFNASIFPSALYEVNPQFAVGTGLNFNYAKYDDIKRVAYGGGLLAFYNPIPFLQLSTEYEQLRINYTAGVGPNAIEDNYWSPALFVGAGYRQRNVTFGIRYNLLHDEGRSIYANDWEPFVRVYF